MSHDDLNRQAFREEAFDLLAELESALLELEEEPDNRELIDRVFRAMHTIKGSGAMFGFDDIAAFTHDVETVFDMVRNGEIAVNKKLLDLTLASRDRILDMLNESPDGSDNNPERSREIIAGMREFLPDAGAEEDEGEPAQAAPPVEEGEKRIFRIRFKPPTDIFFTGTNPVSLLEEIEELGPCLITANLDQLPELADLEPGATYVWWDILLTTTRPTQDIRDVFIFVEDDSEIKIEQIDSTTFMEEDPQYMKLGEILVERGDIEPEVLEAALSGQQRIGVLLQETGAVSPSAVKSALAEQQAVKQARASRQKQEASSSLRVAADKLDSLVDLVGELVIVQAQISQVVSERGDPVLSALSEELERLSDELRDSTLGIRMLPIGTTFSKFRRLVRDLSNELGKEIELETVGAETELDKTVIERLGDPLVHLLRNSIDHGIEKPDARKAKGKPGHGTITLAAEHSGGNVVIRIIDDGKGMDAEAIKAKGVDRGLVSPDAEMSDKEIFNLIFEPGFSMAQEITSVSGRGVGMDVVRRAMDSLRGSISIDSTLGQGTTITIKLPLTLAIIDGLQIKVGDEYYVIPLTLVEECVELDKSQREGKPDQRIVNLRGEIVPYINIREWFQVEGAAPSIEQIVVTNVEGTRVGIVVDVVLGEHQTVIKSLGRIYSNVDGISGATIKGDGSMALILDVPRLVHTVVRAGR